MRRPPVSGFRFPGRVVRIEKLASTGEGIVRTPDGVGFIDRALPGELVATNVYEVRKRFWRGSLSEVREPSLDRIEGLHADCAGCDWAHFEPAAAREAKRALFLETMERIGKLPPQLFGDLPVAASPPGYRLRTRLHSEGGDPGYFAPGTHRVVSAERCESIAEATRALLPAAGEAIAGSGARVSETAILESMNGTRRLLRATVAGGSSEVASLGANLAEHFEGVRIEAPDGATTLTRGDSFLELSAGQRAFQISVDTFFQSNRHLVTPLCSAVEREARRAGPGDALDAFGGAGLFAGSLLEAGHRVTTVESYAPAVADARRTREGWPDRDRWEVSASAVDEFLAGDDRRFACVVADPPRAGLGAALSGALARRATGTFVYVSCDPATLARDLPAILSEGLEIRHAELFDLFASTHRVEALVALERVA